MIRSRKLKDRQYNDRKKMDRMTNNDLQNITQKIKNRVTRTHQLSHIIVRLVFIENAHILRIIVCCHQNIIKHGQMHSNQKRELIVVDKKDNVN